MVCDRAQLPVHCAGHRTAVHPGQHVQDTGRRETLLHGALSAQGLGRSPALRCPLGTQAAHHHRPCHHRVLLFAAVPLVLQGSAGPGLHLPGRGVPHSALAGHQRARRPKGGASLVRPGRLGSPYRSLCTVARAALLRGILLPACTSLHDPASAQPHAKLRLGPPPGTPLSGPAGPSGSATLPTPAPCSWASP